MMAALVVHLGRGMARSSSRYQGRRKGCRVIDRKLFEVPRRPAKNRGDVSLGEQTRRFRAVCSRSGDEHHGLKENDVAVPTIAELARYRWSSDDDADRFSAGDPATGKVITIVQGGGAKQMNAAIEAAHDGLPEQRPSLRCGYTTPCAEKPS